MKSCQSVANHGSLWAASSALVASQGAFASEIYSYPLAFPTNNFKYVIISLVLPISAKTGDFVYTLHAFFLSCPRSLFLPSLFLPSILMLHHHWCLAALNLKNTLLHPRLDDYLGPTVQLLLTLIPIPYMLGYPWHTKAYYLVSLWSAGAHSLSRHPSKSAQWLIDMHPLSPIYMYQIWGRGFWSD